MNNKKLFSNSYIGNIVLFTLIFFISLVMVYIIPIIYYLNKLLVCSCFQKNEIEKKNYADIQYMIMVEYYILIALFIYFLVFYLYYKNIIKTITINFMLILTFIVIVLYIFFIYYTYKIYQNTNKNCTCTESPIRYMLYIQAIFFFFSIILNIYYVLSGKTNKIVKKYKDIFIENRSKSQLRLAIDT